MIYSTNRNFWTTKEDNTNITFSLFAKLLGLPRNKLYDWLREEGILDYKNMPAESYDHFFEIRRNSYKGHSFNALSVTPEGQIFIKEKILSVDIKTITKRKIFNENRKGEIQTYKMSTNEPE